MNLAELCEAYRGGAVVQPKPSGDISRSGLRGIFRAVIWSGESGCKTVSRPLVSNDRGYDSFNQRSSLASIAGSGGPEDHMAKLVEYRPYGSSITPLSPHQCRFGEAYDPCLDVKMTL
ncbi:MAG: hypothetical protein WDM94_08035 [Bauldia sp.]